MRSIFAALLLALAGPALGSSYDTDIQRDHPVFYLPTAAVRALPRAHAPLKTQLPNGDPAWLFDGLSQYLEVPSSPALSVPAGGALTIEAWVRPDTLNFPRAEGDGYVHWAGKG